jgi:hypothetical protein
VASRNSSVALTGAAIAWKLSTYSALAPSNSSSSKEYFQLEGNLKFDKVAPLKRRWGEEALCEGG